MLIPFALVVFTKFAAYSPSEFTVKVLLIVAAPVVLSVPPTFKLPATPAPPAITNAPVVGEDDSVGFYIFRRSELFGGGK